MPESCCRKTVFSVSFSLCWALERRKVSRIFERPGFQRGQMLAGQRTMAEKEQALRAALSSGINLLQNYGQGRFAAAPFDADTDEDRAVIFEISHNGLGVGDKNT